MLSRDERPVASKLHSKICAATPIKFKPPGDQLHNKPWETRRAFHLKLMRFFSRFKINKSQTAMHPETRVDPQPRASQRDNWNSRSTKQQCTKLKLTLNTGILYREMDIPSVRQQLKEDKRHAVKMLSRDKPVPINFDQNPATKAEDHQRFSCQHFVHEEQSRRSNRRQHHWRSGCLNLVRLTHQCVPGSVP